MYLVALRGKEKPPKDAQKKGGGFLDPLFRVLYVTLNTLKEKGAFFLTLRIRWETTEPNDMDDADENDDETSKRRRKEGMVLDAIRNRVSFIQEKKTELGEKGFRRILEKDLKLEKRALDDVKDVIGKLLLRVVETGNVDEEEEEDFDDDEEEEDVSDQNAARTIEEEEEEEEKGWKKKKKTTTKTKSREGPKDETVAKLGRMCKAAGITKATHVFMKHKTNDERQKALEELLGERGLDIRSSAKDLARVKENIEREKDLEDIDASNIIEGGRRSRNRTQVSYKGLDVSESEEEEEEESDDVEIESDSERKKKKKRSADTPASRKKKKKSASPKAFTAVSSSEDDE